VRKNVLELLRKLFSKQKVLEIHDVITAMHTTTRMTAYNYLKKLDYLSSYTHAGKYYTLKDIPKFDKDGLWHYGEIGFSKYGTLKETIVHLVNTSENGKTSSELEKQQRIYVQNALLSLVKGENLTRKEVNGLYVYVSSDPEVSYRQIKIRTEVGSRKRLPDWIVGEILVETIRSFPGQAEVEEVVKRLSKRGSLITREQVTQVFEENHLLKKTLG
jgi:hypothetical protein